MNKEDFEYFYEIKRKNETLEENIKFLSAEIEYKKRILNTYNRCLDRVIKQIQSDNPCLYDLRIKPIIDEEKAFVETLEKAEQKDK